MSLDRTLDDRPRPAAARAVGRPGVAGSVLLAAIGIFVAARALTSLFILYLTTTTTSASEAGASPSFAHLSSVWDGRWYRQIALHGYPLQLPLDSNGHVAQNAWAFLPGYPFVTRIVALTGLGWEVSAVITALAFGAGAAVLLAVLLAPHVGGRRALWAVALFSVSPVSFILQMAYADSMMVFLLLAAICLLDRDRAGWAVPVVLLASLTRPGLLAFALAVALHLLVRRREGRLGPRDTVWGLVLLAASGAGGLAWPVIVGLVTRRPDAYVLTETAWRALWTGSADFTLFEPWIFVAQQLFGIGAVPVLGLLIGLFVWFVRRPAAALGSTSRLWIASYGVYLLAVFMPQTSLPRLLLPMSPALGAFPVPRRRSTAVLVLAASTLLQLAWLWCTYGPVKTYLTVP